MTWVVDTCILIDVFRGDKTFAAMSSMALQSKLDDVLTVAPITYVELSPEFNGDAAAQDAFLDAMWIHRDFNGSKEAVLLAHKAWHEHIMRKRAGISYAMLNRFASASRKLHILRAGVGEGTRTLDLQSHNLAP